MPWIDSAGAHLLDGSEAERIDGRAFRKINSFDGTLNEFGKNGETLDYEHPYLR